MPKAVTRYIPPRIARSAQVTKRFQRTRTAVRKAANGSKTAVRLTSLWARDMTGRIAGIDPRISSLDPRRDGPFLSQLDNERRFGGERPWEALPRDVADVIRPELPALADDVIVALREGVPAYAQPLEGAFGRGVRLGVESALRQFVEMIGQPGSARLGREVYVNLGRGEMPAGGSLNALLSAYRLGARAAWRRISAAGARAGLPPETLYRVAEAMFAYIDELSADSVEGYAL